MNRNNDGKRGGAAAFLALFLTVAGGASARAAAPTTPAAGVVISIEGKPRVVRVGAKAAGTLKLNDILNEGDTVKTRSSERVGIAFVGGAELRINEGSSFTMENGGGDKPTSVFTRWGNAWTNLLKGAKVPINVRTPTAVCAVRGTIADVNIGAGPMTIKVYEGHVNVNDPSTDKLLTALHENQLTTVAGVGAAPQTRAMTPQDYGTWQNSLKPANMSQSLKILNAAAVKNRTLDMKMKDRDGKEKDIRLNFEKKQQ